MFKRFGSRSGDAGKGWRSFAFEVSIVVIGVLIALGAQQLVERWTWERKVAVAEESLLGEQGMTFLLMAERVQVTPCVLEQLDRLREHVLQPEAAREPLERQEDALGSWVLREPYRPISSDAWEAETTAGTVGHMDAARRQNTALSYALLDGYLARQEENSAAQAQLLILTEPIALDSASKVRLLENMAQYRSRPVLQEIVASQIMAAIDRLDRTPPAEAIEAMAQQNSGTIAFCRENDLPLADWRERMERFAVPPVGEPE